MEAEVTLENLTPFICRCSEKGNNGNKQEARKVFAEEFKKLSDKCGLKQVCWCENKNAKTSTLAYSIHELYFNDGTSINAMELLKAMNANIDQSKTLYN